MNSTTYILVLLGSLATLPLFAQVKLHNASFEGRPVEASPPEGWQPCRQGSTPDILPGPWEVRNIAREGKTYMGLITRSDGSWESVGQALAHPLEPNACYSFSLYLARSDAYANYNMPVRLRIWGGTTPREKSILLAETDAVDHKEWKKYDFSFVPSKKIMYFILEAYYASGYYFEYNGNILLDHCSDIQPCRRAMRWSPATGLKAF